MRETPRYRLIIFLTCLMKVAQIQAQCGTPNVGENMVMINDLSQQTFPDGSTVTFKCSTGYKPVDPSASRTITCIGTEWTKLELTCTKKSCGALPDIPNGKYTFPNGNLFGATAIAQCNDGYVVVGEKTRTCRDNGWDGRDPVCEAVTCLPPPSIPNGQFEPVEESYNYNQPVIYSCSRDYTLIGESTITCSNNGSFLPSPPQCRVVQCDTPNIANAVRVEGKAPPYGYKNFVRYKCNEGYTMNGSDYLVCEVEGWVPPPPECITQCGRPNVGENMVIINDSGQQTFPDGSTVTFKCSTGYKPVDPSASRTVTCIGTEWTKLELTCTKKSCGALPDIPNGKYTFPNGNLFGATAIAQCNDGYVVVGEKTRTCRDDGWDGRDPVCEAQCGRPNVGENMVMINDSSQQTFSNGSTVTFKCSTGYKPVDPSASRTVTCNGTEWTKLELICTINQIPHPTTSSPSDGTRVKPSVVIIAFVVSVVVLLGPKNYISD